MLTQTKEENLSLRVPSTEPSPLKLGEVIAIAGAICIVGFWLYVLLLLPPYLLDANCSKPGYAPASHS
ncbi:MAG: hypothetical protein HC851_19135 [Acaryochloris sp. RU_4_1]|nr:hypothetical protein [Acaryochloris sp. RU_4_1]NJR55648.1 hypothetical protein [Acaryochloris sp. CRU_2_0]